MEILFYILVLFLLIILLIIFIPIQIVLSSKKGVVSITYGRLFTMGLKFVGEELTFYYKLPFKGRNVGIIETIASGKQVSGNHKNQSSQKKGSSKWINTIWNRSKKRWKAILNSFRVKEMDINLDTDDFILNAYLYPIFQYLGRRYHKSLAINFMGINKVELKVRTRLAHLLHAYLT